MAKPVFRFIITGMFFVMFFSGCSSPKYKIEKIYYPPTDKACVDRCQKEFQKCQDTCQRNYNECLLKAPERAQKIYDQLEREYTQKLQEYYKQYRIYQNQLREREKIIERLKRDLKFYERLCAQYKDKEACYRKKNIKKALERLKYNTPVAPQKPEEISFKEILDKERALCRCDCGCKEIFDACYQACGGKVEIKRICVEDCDKD